MFVSRGNNMKKVAILYGIGTFLLWFFLSPSLWLEHDSIPLISYLCMTSGLIIWRNKFSPITERHPWLLVVAPLLNFFPTELFLLTTLWFFFLFCHFIVKRISK